VCQKKSGNAMACTSCHDPHYEPSATERASYYRQKCLACQCNKFAAGHHADKPDRTTCHMASSLSRDIAHTEVTEASRGHLREAVRLWNQAFQRAPSQSPIGMNVARALCAAGQVDGARDYVLRVLEFNPDLQGSKDLLKRLNGGVPKCEH
jgi:tetratricopeptide (TPR) repeat protein